MLPVFSSRESLYFETGREPISSRRNSKKLTTMYKTQNNLVPYYLRQIFSGTQGSLSRYNIRNASDYSSDTFHDVDSIYFRFYNSFD